MQPHHFEKAAEYEVTVRKGFTTLRPGNYSAAAGEAARNFRQPVDEKQLIRGMLFTGFLKCLYPVVRFQSDSERRLSVVFENDATVRKWLKPEKGQFKIFYRNDREYVPDFAVETETEKFLCEPKRADEIDDAVVQDKQRAAVEWCKNASDHAKSHGGKSWQYLLIPHDKIAENMTLAGLAAKYAVAWTP
jgi:type III restriction enzyme